MDFKTDIIKFIELTKTKNKILDFFPYITDFNTLKSKIERFSKHGEDENEDEIIQKNLLKPTKHMSLFLVGNENFDEILKSSIKLFKNDQSDLTSLNLYVSEEYKLSNFKKLFIEFKNLNHLILVQFGNLKNDIFDEIFKNKKIFKLSIYSDNNDENVKSSNKLSFPLSAFENLPKSNLEFLELKNIRLKKKHFDYIHKNTNLSVICIECSIENNKFDSICKCLENKELESLKIPMLSKYNINFHKITDLELTSLTSPLKFDEELKLVFPNLRFLKVKFTEENWKIISNLLLNNKIKILEIAVVSNIIESLYEIFKNGKTPKTEKLKMHDSLERLSIKGFSLEDEKPNKEIFKLDTLDNFKNLKSLKLENLLIKRIKGFNYKKLEEIIFIKCKTLKFDGGGSVIKNMVLIKNKHVNALFKNMDSLSIVEICNKSKDSFFFK